MGREPSKKSGRDGYGTLALKRREAGEKIKTLILRHFQKQELRILFDLHLATPETSEQTSK